MNRNAKMSQNLWIIKLRNRKLFLMKKKIYKFFCLSMRKEYKILSQLILDNQALNQLNLEFLAIIV
jgi:hypothetical protein